jgi:hypothetical protein
VYKAAVSSVCTVIMLRARRQKKNVALFSAREIDFSLLQKIYAEIEVHTLSHAVCRDRFSAGSKSAEV